MEKKEQKKHKKKEILMSKDIVTFNGVDYKRELLDTYKRVLCPELTDSEAAIFAHACARTGLDPFMKQIHAVKRKGKLCIQTGIDGFRLIAERTGKYCPGQEPTFVYNKENDPNSGIKSCTAYVKKLTNDGTWHTIAATAYFDEYIAYKTDGTITEMWRTKRHIMIAKCAEALAIRKAWPADFSGIYERTEMEQADNPDLEVIVTVSKEEILKNELQEYFVSWGEDKEAMKRYFEVKKEQFKWDDERALQVFKQKGYEKIMETFTVWKNEHNLVLV